MQRGDNGIVPRGIDFSSRAARQNPKKAFVVWALWGSLGPVAFDIATEKD
jgi:hypothetical protein